MSDRLTRAQEAEEAASDALYRADLANAETGSREDEAAAYEAGQAYEAAMTELDAAWEEAQRREHTGGEYEQEG